MASVPIGGEGRHDARHVMLDIGPGSAYEAVTRQMVEHLAEELDEIKGRLNGLLFAVVGATVIDLVVRLGGG